MHPKSSTRNSLFVSNGPATRLAGCKTASLGRAIGMVMLLSSQASAQAEPGATPPADAGATPPVEKSESEANPPSAIPTATTIEKQLKEMMGRPGGLTAKTVAQRAVATSSDVATRESEVRVARADVDRVLYTSLPRVNLLARYTRLSPVGRQAFGPNSGALVATTDPPGPLAPGAPLIGIPADALAFPEVLNQYLLQASVTVPLSDYLFSTPSAVSAADANEQAARVNREAAKLDVAMRARMLYYDWVRARLAVVIGEKSVEQALANARTAKTAFEAGRVSKADVLNAESLAASAELRTERARTQAALAEERVRVAMHDAPDARYQIGEDLFAPRPKAGSESFASLVQEARQKRLELRALEHASQSLAEQGDVADMRGAPKLEAFGNAYYARPNQRFIAVQDEWKATWDLGVQLSWSPNDLGTSRSDSRSLDAQRTKLSAQRAALMDRIQQDVLEAYTSLQEAELSVVTAQRNLQAAEEAYRVQRLFYENGRGTTLELLDSESRLLQARIDAVNVRVAQHMAEVALDHAVGRDVPGDAVR